LHLTPSSHYQGQAVSAIRCIVKFIPDLRQKCNISKSVIFQGELLKVLKCYSFLLVHRRHNCSPALSFANCFMTLYLLKVHLKTFLSIPITQKCRFWVVTLLSQMSGIFWMKCRFLYR